MNERIREIAKSVQCERHWTEEDIEKFAELIVRECATLAYEGPGGILEHFGVEE